MRITEAGHLIDRARRAWLRSSLYDGRAPRIADCEISVRGGRKFIELKDGQETIALYSIRNGGDLRHMKIDGKYQ